MPSVAALASHITAARLYNKNGTQLSVPRLIAFVF